MQKYLFILLLLVFSCEETLEPDTSAPTVVITYPVNETTLTATTIVKVDVSDNGEINSVTFLIDGNQAYADSTAPYEYEWDVCILGTGSHSVLVKAEDSAGNKGQSELYSFTINASYDCADICGGDTTFDECGICNGNGPLQNYDCDNNCIIDIDCEGTCGGSVIVDDCGVCGGDDTTCNRCRIVTTQTETITNANSCYDSNTSLDNTTETNCYDNISQEECSNYFSEENCYNYNDANTHCDINRCSSTAIYYEQGSCDAYCLDNYCEDSATNILYVLYEISVPISGFQFNVESLDTSTVLITDVMGGLAVESGLSVTTSPTSVLGFSMSANFIPAGSGTLLVLQIEGSIHNACLSNPVLSGLDGVSIPAIIVNCNNIQQTE